ncbi:uncharacterized protein LOC135219635 [Macrobrachium nipponense]|uniref:uncharacterized protein LOC135219635 n=1 Tax=Macrobrachium nipponense TaxID=159736 RepID=UPI0030C87197
MSGGNCTVKEDISGWVIAAVWEQFVVCFIGAICNAVSIWCLLRCQRTGKAVKLQLICIFGLQTAISLVTLPFVTYLYYADFFCLENGVPKQVQFLFSILNSILLQGERLNFMALAVFRAVAVIYPNKYRKLAITKIVVSIQLGILLCIVPPWIILGIIKGFDFSSSSGSVIRLQFRNGSSFHFVRALYGIYYCLPFVVTVVACTFMMIALIRQRQHAKALSKKRQENMDQVASTIRVVLLTNVLLDGPHVVFHLVEDLELATVITHMAFFLHLVLDPAIFVCMNRNYREEILQKTPLVCTAESPHCPWRSCCPPEIDKEPPNEGDSTI